MREHILKWYYFGWRAGVLGLVKINTPAICLLSMPSVLREILILAFVTARGTAKIGNRFFADGSKCIGGELTSYRSTCDPLAIIQGISHVEELGIVNTI